MIGFLQAENFESRDHTVGDDVISIHRYTFGSTVQVESFASQTSDSSDRFKKMEMLYKSQKMLLEPVNCYTLNCFSNYMERWHTGYLLPLHCILCL